MLIHADGVDFTQLGPTWLAVGLFVAVPAAFGASIGVVVDRVAAPGSWTRRGGWRWALPIVLVAAFPLTVVLLAIAAAVLVVTVTARASTAGRFPFVVGLTVRAVWLAIAVAGLVALLRDIAALA